MYGGDGDHYGVDYDNGMKGKDGDDDDAIYYDPDKHYIDYGYENYQPEYHGRKGKSMTSGGHNNKYKNNRDHGEMYYIEDDRYYVWYYYDDYEMDSGDYSYGKGYTSSSSPKKSSGGKGKGYGSPKGKGKGMMSSSSKSSKSMGKGKGSMMGGKGYDGGKGKGDRSRYHHSKPSYHHSKPSSPSYHPPRKSPTSFPTFIGGKGKGVQRDDLYDDINYLFDDDYNDNHQYGINDWFY